MVERIYEVGGRVEKRRKEGRLGIVKQFVRILRKLRFGTTINELMRDENMSRRTVHRWIEVVDKLFGVEKIPSNRVGANWVYRVDRERVKERI